MESTDSSLTGGKKISWILIATFCLTILNLSFDFVTQYKILEYREALIIAVLTGIFLFGLYSIRFFKKDIIRPFDYLKLVSILLVAGYPFIHLYATKPWDNPVRVISLYFPLAVYIFDRFVLNSLATTRQKFFVSVAQTVFVGFFLVYSQILAEVARETELKRIMEREERLIDKEKADQLLIEANQKVIELKRELEKCK